MSSMPRVVLLMSPGHGYERGILRGIARYARHHGPWVFFLAGEQLGAPPQTIDAPLSKVLAPRSSFDLKGLGATGVIGRLFNSQIVGAVLESGLPAVAMDMTDEQLAAEGPLGRVSEIHPDSHKAGRLAAEHLLDRGFRRFAFCGYLDENWSRGRQEGFVGRLREAGFACDVFQPAQRRDGTPWHKEQPAAVAWLKSLEKPVGVLCCNDIRGRQVIEACAAGGMRVPEDVAVAGCDEDHILSELANPPLSSVAWNAEQGGYHAAELLADMM
ncbi:MAG: XylR family transcriptional regulator, partial [Thermoguttaceae bacterium]